MLVSEAFGGWGGIAKFNRDFVAAVASHAATTEVVVVPRRFVGPAGTLPDKLDYRQHAAGGRGAFFAETARLAATGGHFDVIVSGHSHQAYNCTIDGKLVTSAASAGRLVTDIDLQIQRADGEVVSKSARNLVVSRDVEKDPRETALIAHYRPVAETVGGRVVGSIAASLLRAVNGAGESALGDVIADGMLEGARNAPGGDAVVAFTNLGGIRADILRTGSGAAMPVTYAQLFEVVPFGNVVMVKSLTGEAIVQVLEQQFDLSRILQVSQGFTYAYDTSRPRGRRIDRSSIRINGAPLVPTERYRVATTDFLWTSGDGFTGLGSGTDPVTIGVDVDVFADYFSDHSPVSPGQQDRIHKTR